MIEKITDFGKLSGVSSPLLPLIYADGVFSQNSVDGAFVQKHDNDEILSVFSLKNTCVTLVLINGNNLEELEKFFSFCGVTEILSNKNITQLCNNQKELSLLEFCGSSVEKTDCLNISPKSNTNEYNDIYKVVFENGDSFEIWFPEFTKKINSANAFATYLKVNEKVVSTALSPAIYKNTAIIAGVFTLEEYRNKGLATLCVKGLLNKLIENNTKEIYLWCEDKNIFFYNKIGFETIDKIYIGECK